MDKKGRIRVDVIVLILLLVILAILVIFYLNKRGIIDFSSQTNTKTVITPRPRPTVSLVYPLPTGKQVFSVSYGANDTVKPQIKSISVDPLVSSLSSSHILMFSVTSPSPVTSTEVTLISDSKKMNIPVRLISGTNMDGEWRGEWIANDTTNKIYKIEFKIGSETGVRNDDIVFR